MTFTTKKLYPELSIVQVFGQGVDTLLLVCTAPSQKAADTLVELLTAANEQKEITRKDFGT